MTLIQKTMAAVLMCLVSAVSFAQNTPGKVAILDLQAAVLSTEFAKKEIAALDKNPQYAAMKAKLDGLAADMKKLQTEAEKDGMTWSAEKQAEHRKKVEYIRADYELEGKKLQAEQQAVVQHVMQTLGPKVRAALEQLTESEKIGLVLNAQAAMYASPAHDITPKLTEMLNKAK